MNSIHTDPFTPLNRLGLWAIRYLRLRDILQAGLVVTTYYFLSRTFLFHRELAIAAGSIYSLAILIIGIEVFRGRQARDRALSIVLHGFFEHLSNEVFRDDPNVRITLFRPACFNGDYIVAWYRHCKQDGDLIGAALRSRAKYRMNEGFTGAAWAQGAWKLTCCSFPDFGGSRESFETYYIKDLGIPKETVRNLSNTMVNVRTILSYGLHSKADEFLGVLSIDLQTPIEVDPEIAQPRVGSSYVYSDSLIQTLRSINAVLEGFSRAQSWKS